MRSRSPLPVLLLLSAAAAVGRLVRVASKVVYPPQAQVGPRPRMPALQRQTCQRRTAPARGLSRRRGGAAADTALNWTCNAGDQPLDEAAPPTATGGGRACRTAATTRACPRPAASAEARDGPVEAAAIAAGTTAGAPAATPHPTGGVSSTRSGTDEKRYEMEPSTTPTDPSWYDVAKLELASDESVSRSPRGVWKSRSPACRDGSQHHMRCATARREYSVQTRGAAHTVRGGVERGIRVVAAPARRLVERAVDMVHELAHLSARYLMPCPGALCVRCAMCFGRVRRWCAVCRSEDGRRACFTATTHLAATSDAARAGPAKVRHEASRWIVSLPCTLVRTTLGPRALLDAIRQ